MTSQEDNDSPSGRPKRARCSSCRARWPITNSGLLTWHRAHPRDTSYCLGSRELPLDTEELTPEARAERAEKRLRNVLEELNAMATQFWRLRDALNKLAKLPMQKHGGIDAEEFGKIMSEVADHLEQ